MFSLIKEAIAMLKDRCPEERALIIYVASMPDELRAAIVMASRLMRDDEREETEH